MKIILFIALLIASTVFADHHVLLSKGGTTCIPDEADSCTAKEGSTHVTVTGGVSVNGDNECSAGTADTFGVQVSFTAEASGFFSIGSQGVGAFKGSSAYAVLVFSGDATLDTPCNAMYTFRSGWSGWLAAGDYNIVVTANDAADATVCGEFGVSVSEIEYELTGTIDTWIQTGLVAGSCIASTNAHVALVTYTPAAAGTFLFSGVGRANGTDTGLVAPLFIALTADLPSNYSDAQSYCDASADFVAFDAGEGGYVLTAAEYTVAFQDFDTSGSGIDIFANAIEVVEIVYPACDELPEGKQDDWKRPNVPATDVTSECEEGDTDYKFDVRQITYDYDAFVIVDTISCTNPDDSRSSVDGAVVLYYGKKGTPADGDTDAVAPEPCDDFIIAGDSGDGGAVYYWFPADADITIVPTTYSTTSSEVYTLTTAAYEIAGCVPENPYLEVPETGSSSIVMIVGSLFALALL